MIHKYRHFINCGVIVATAMLIASEISLAFILGHATYHPFPLVILFMTMGAVISTLVTCVCTLTYLEDK